MERQAASSSGTSRRRARPSSTFPEKVHVPAIGAPLLTDGYAAALPLLDLFASVSELNEHIWVLYEPTNEPSMDIMFFHGLQFKVSSTPACLFTWTCGDVDGTKRIWPSTWLIEDFPNARILSVSYDACIKRTHDGGRFDLHSVTENLIQAISWVFADIGPRPLVLVGHCFGGLVIKSLCIEANHRTHDSRPSLSQSTQNCKRFIHNMEGAFFYGTPHRGIKCPLFGDVIAYFLGGPLLTYVKLLSADSARLDANFLALRENYICHNKIWHIASVGESRPTSWGLFSLLSDVVVPEASARYGENFCMAAEDHFTLCKPSARTSTSFQVLKTFIMGIYPKGGVAAALRQRELRMAFSLDFRKDDRYVPLKQSESKIHSAFNVNTDGQAAVILLHGEGGKGKSTLARAIALHYGDATDDNAALFEHVVYLECGPEAEILDKQFKLLQMLGDGTANPQEQAQQSDSASNLTIPKRLRDLLKDQKLLIIFDDVWNEEFLQRMVDLFGRKIKCLVTSQRGDLCRDLNCLSIPIQIEDIEQEDARKILASHVGFQDQCIPKHLEKIADEMIQGTERNPLALAILARQIDLKRSDELYEWSAVSKEVVKALQSDRLAYIHGKKYPLSFWSTMQRSFEFLKKEAQKLLILVGMCDGLSIPEEVIDLLHRSIDVKNGSTTFRELRQELDSRGMVKINVLSKYPHNGSATFSVTFGELWRKLDGPRMVKIAVPLTKYPQMQRRWSIHSLQKQFIEDIRDDRESTFISLGGLPSIEARSTVESEVVREFSISEEDVVITLKALYFDVQFGMRAALKTGITFSRFNNLRRSAIEPVTRLLGQHLDDDWTESLRNSAKRVFLRYIQSDVLDDDAISDLLGSPISRFAMMSAFQNIAILGEMTILDENQHNCVEHLIGVLKNVDDEEDIGIWVAVAQALNHICRSNHSRTFILTKMPSVLKALTGLLTNPHHLVCSWATHIIGSLCTVSEPGYTSQVVVQYSTVVEDLVKNLFVKTWFEDGAWLQQSVICALGNLAFGHHDVKFKIVNADGVVEELVKFLSNNDKPKLQAGAAWTLGNLAWGEESCDCSVKLIIAHSPRAVENLVKSLSKDDNPELQTYAALALANLAVGHEGIRLIILNSPLVVEDLVKLLSKDGNLELQAHAARVLANLAAGFDRELIIAHIFPMALENLVKSLSKDDNPALQEEATRALTNLAFGSQDEVKLRIVNSHGTLKNLVKFLSTDDKPKLQTCAVRTLATLASGNDNIKLIIANSLRAVDDLVKCLSKDDNSKLQETVTYALVTLSHLAEGHDNIKFMIASPKTVNDIVKLLSKDENPKLQVHAIGILCNLAHIIRLMIRNSIEAVDNLVKSLSKDDNTELQADVARALANLSSRDHDEVKWIVANSTGAVEDLLKSLSKDGNPILEDLVKSLSKDGNPMLQDQATQALGNLTCEDHDKLNSIMVNFPRTLENLVESLSKDDKPKLQAVAAQTLANLAWGEFNCDCTVKLIIAYSPRVVEGLVKSLSKDDNPMLQVSAALALTNLAVGHDAIKLIILNSPMAIENLVNLLSKDGNLELQAQVAWVLGNLAAGSNSKDRKGIKLIILNSPMAIENLAKSLLKDDNPKLQQEAAWALANLAYESYDEINLIMINSLGTLENLVKSLSKDGNPMLQEHAGRALGYLTCGNHEKVNLIMANSPGTLENLVISLFKDDNPKLQAHVAHALAHIAQGHDNLKLIAHSLIDKAMQGLVESLSKDINPKLQVIAAWTLASLALGPDEIKWKIVNSFGVEALVNSLSKDENAKLQEGAAMALINLGNDHDKIKWIIVNTLKAAMKDCHANIDKQVWQEFVKLSLKDDNNTNLDKQVLCLYKSFSYDTLLFQYRVQAKVGNYQGALADVDKFTETARRALDLKKREGLKQVTGDLARELAFQLQERGTLKKMMGDFPGALADLNEGLEIGGDNYEILKHRGHVKFLRNDEAGAIADAKWAMKIKPSYVDGSGYGLGYGFAFGLGYLGTSSVEYYDYKLR